MTKEIRDCMSTKERTERLSDYIHLPDPDKLNALSHDQQVYAVGLNPLDIDKVIRPTEAIQMAAVSKNPYSIQWIEHPSEKVQLTALRALDASVVKVVQNPCEAFLVEVLKQDGMMIEHVINPTDEMKEEATSQNPSAASLCNMSQRQLSKPEIDIADLVEDAFTIALSYIQDKLGQQHGDFASMHFSDSLGEIELDQMAIALVRYAEAEMINLEEEASEKREDSVSKAMGLNR